MSYALLLDIEHDELNNDMYRFLIFVATFVEYSKALYSLFGALHNLCGALYNVLGLCIICWGFVKYPDVSPPQSISPPPPPGPTAAAAVAQGGAGGPPSPWLRSEGPDWAAHSVGPGDGG